MFNLTFVFLVLLMGSSFAKLKLSTDFYSKTCPKLLDTVKPVVECAVSKEKRMGASLLRLHFHDCFVHGCDGSILLDDTPCSIGEKHAGPNNNSVRGYNVIDAIKSRVEDICPGVVSCADIVAIAARDSVVLLGGPNWDVKLGRRDSRKASKKAAEKGLVSPSSSLEAIISRYHALGFSTRDMVALSGGHTIGLAKCSSFSDRIYKDPNIDASFAKTRQASCPPSGNAKRAPLDLKTPTSFDNSYFKNLLSQKGLLHSDQELYNGGSTDSIVEQYSKDPSTFYSDFAAAMVKMGDIRPLTGSKGEIRKHCWKAN